MTSVQYLTSELIASDKTRHAFFTRVGGTSSGIYESLNGGLGSEDDREAVEENRSRMAAILDVPLDAMLTPYQIHSPYAVVVEEPWEPGRGPRADGIATRRNDIAIGVTTADCTPVLFSDEVAGVIGAAHAGWRGALGGVLGATTSAMLRLGAQLENIRAAIGPTISQKNYEVGPEFETEFVTANANHERFFITGPKGRPHFDLPGFVAHQLDQIGVHIIDNLERCTYEDAGLFFSYRRTTHAGETDYGRQLSMIRLNN